MNPASALPCWLMLPLFLSGCVAPADHPSLAPRAVEQFTTIEPTPPPPAEPAIPEDASRQQRVTALVAQARETDTRFRQHLAEAQGAVANGTGAAIGSEAWVQAQQAVSRADVARASVTQNLADLNALQISSAETGVGTETGSVLAAALDEVGSIAAAEDQAIAKLAGRLAAP